MFSIILMTHGAFVNPKNPQVRTVELPVNGLPAAFNNFKLVHISDIHLGSWGSNHSYFNPIIQLINEQDADILVFTGDMVNNYQEEMRGWTPLFQQLKARGGKYAVLGNHDYGDYSEWDSPQHKKANLDSIKLQLQNFGFTVLLNKSVEIQKDSSVLELLGVENWGKPPFPKYGNLEKTMKGTREGTPKILLSHDPSHWKGEILNYPDIVLTLSGHTHAAQLAFNWYGKTVSPSSWVYKEWDGLYNEGSQYLYINRGLGFIGIPVRIGTARPEITVIQLIQAENL
jgi:predicted MPP superfamily phosphohydrolase